MDQKHFNGKRFFNPTNPKGNNSLSKTMRFLMQYALRRSWPKQQPNYAVPELHLNIKTDQAAVTFINHASFLIQLQGLNILTDPIWSLRASPLPWIGPKRVRNPGIEFDELPRIDLVIVSHNHYDHMDVSSIKLLSEKFGPLILVPVGAGKLLSGLGIDNVHEMDWWDSLEVLKQTTVVFTPAQHFSARSLFDRNRSLWGSYMIQLGRYRIFFGGDTGYSAHFQEIRRRLGEPDLALLPIGAWDQEEFVKSIHMNSRDAVQAHLDLGSRKSLAMHFGTFQMSTGRPIDQPAVDLRHSLNEFNVDPDSFEVPKEGKTMVISFGGTGSES